MKSTGAARRRSALAYQRAAMTRRKGAGAGGAAGVHMVRCGLRFPAAHSPPAGGRRHGSDMTSTYARHQTFCLRSAPRVWLVGWHGLLLLPQRNAARLRRVCSALTLAASRCMPAAFGTFLAWFRCTGMRRLLAWVAAPIRILAPPALLFWIYALRLRCGLPLAAAAVPRCARILPSFLRCSLPFCYQDAMHRSYAHLFARRFC